MNTNTFSNVDWDKVINDAFFEAIDICFFDDAPEEVYPPDDTEEDFLKHEKEQSGNFNYDDDIDEIAWENEQRELHYGGQSEFRDQWTLDE